MMQSMASLLTKDLASRVITSANPRAAFAQPIGGDGESSYSSANMLMIGEPDQKEMSATFRICEGSEDDDGDIVDPMGCVLDRYQRNPIVLFHHDKDRPAIGISEDKSKRLHLEIHPKEIIAKCFFHGLPFDNKNWSREIFDLVCAGALRGASIGFLPIEARKRGHDKDSGYHFTRYLLTEWSITPIPSNSDTLRLCLSKGYVKSLELKTRLESMLPVSPQWANGASLPTGVKKMSKKLGVANIEFDRAVYKTVKDCVGFLKARGYDSSLLVSELPTAFVYQQSNGKPGAGQKSLAKGVVANLYVKKAKADDEDEEKDDDIPETAETETTPMEDETVEKADDIAEIETPADETESTEDEAEETAEDEAPDAEEVKAEATKVALAINHFKAYLDHVEANPHSGPMAEDLAGVDGVLTKAVETLTEKFGANYAAHAIDALAPMGASEPAAEPEPVEMDADVDLDDEITKADDEDEMYKSLLADVTKIRQRASRVSKSLPVVKV